MYSIRTWYNRNAKLPLIGLIIAVVTIQSIYFAFVLNENEVGYRDLMDNVIRVSGVALMQKNRVMLESLLYTISQNPSFREFYICENGNAILALPVGKSVCAKRQSTLWMRVDQFEVPGFSEFQIFAVVPHLKLPTAYLIVAIATIVISVISIVLVVMVSNRFEREILHPILTDFDKYSQGQIIELSQLRERRNKVVELEKEKVIADLAKQVAHDIRSPASALQIFASKKSALFKAEESSLLSSIVERIIKISDDLLLRSKNVHSAEVVSVSVLIETTKRIVAEKALLHRLSKVTLNGPNGLPNLELNLKVAAGRWGRMISNLIENSVEASSAVGSEVEMEFGYDQGHVVFKIMDSGRGMPPDVLRRVRVSGGSFGKEKGNGLGLNAMRDLVSDAGGEWSIDSSEGLGTTITLKLPIV